MPTFEIDITREQYLYFFRFFICWYLKLRFVLNTFWAKNPKSNHSAMEHRKRNQLEINENRPAVGTGSWPSNEGIMCPD